MKCTFKIQSTSVKTVLVKLEFRKSSIVNFIYNLRSQQFLKIQLSDHDPTFELRGGRWSRLPAKILSTVASSLVIVLFYVFRSLYSWITWEVRILIPCVCDVKLWYFHEYVLFHSLLTGYLQEVVNKYFMNCKNNQELKNIVSSNRPTKIFSKASVYC